MKVQLRFFVFSMLFCRLFGGAQNVSLYSQFSGHYDFVFAGNTLNQYENGTGMPCDILTGSSTTLNLNAGDQIIKAYLYWAGSGEGDFDVLLNGTQVTAQRTFSIVQTSTLLPFFSAFADVTPQVSASGSGNYTLSDLDVSAVIPNYCPNATNFAGWALVVVYANDALPLNQINIYDGLQAVPDSLSITLENLNVIDNANAQIGFVAWEGDQFLAIDETLRINGNEIGNPPLNPVNNAFNGTNSFTGASNLYNMDLDVYNIQNYIHPGDETANITLSSGRDFVMINTVVTKLNSRLPDAVITIDGVDVECASRRAGIHYSVGNIGTNTLPANTAIAMYADGVLVGQGTTAEAIPVGGSLPGYATIVIPASVPADFELTLTADDDGTGTGAVAELDENNNSAVQQMHIGVPPTFNALADVYSCNESLGRGTFDFSSYADAVRTNATDVASFYVSETDAQSHTKPISDISDFTAAETPKQIFVRVDNAECYVITSFWLRVRNCPPVVYNFVTADGDGFNDSFFIKGLRDIFLNFHLEVYNRWGRLVWTGNNSQPDWRGESVEGYRPFGNFVPDGTYYYVLELNDPDYPDPLYGYLYLKR